MSLDTEKQVIARILWRFIPFLGPCYLVNWLDRTNVGFAGFTMNKELGFSATVFGTGAGIFFLGYVLFEVPSSLALARFGARPWITLIMVTWGFLAAAMALVNGETSYYILRFVLGVAEGGFYPGVLYLFSQWIPYGYRAGAYGILAIFGSLALSVGGPLTSWIMHLDGVFGLSGWRWLFILEGLPAIALGVICYFYLTDGPETARWLSSEDRSWLTQKLSAERASYGSLHEISLWQGLSDRRVLILGAVYFSFGLALFGVGLWTPLIIKHLGVSNTTAAYLTVVPGLCGIASVLFWPRHSDRNKERRWHLVTMGIGTASGLLLSALMAGNPIAVMVGLCFAAFCSLGSYSIIMTWPTTAMSGATSAGAIALIAALGTTSGYFGPQLIGILRDLTGGFESAMAYMACGVLIGPVLLIFFGRFMNVTSHNQSEVTAVGAVPGRT